MAFNSFTPNTTIRSAAMNTNFAGIADGSELPDKTQYIDVQMASLSVPQPAEVTTAASAAYFYFDKSKFTNVQSIILSVRMYTSDALTTCYYKIYNETDAAAMTTLTTNALGATTVIESADIKAQFAAGRKLYRATGWADGAAGNQFITNARLIVTWK